MIYLAVKYVNGAMLSLHQVQRTDMGGYLCIATNGVPPSVSKRFDVQVNCKYVYITITFACTRIAKSIAPFISVHIVGLYISLSVS